MEKENKKEEINPEKTSENRIKRDEKGRILPGFSGNPKGRPKGSLSLVKLLKDELEREIENEEGTDKTSYATLLIRKMLRKAVIEGDTMMIKDIINRIDGMPKQTVGIKDETEPEENRLLDVIEDLDDETQHKLISAINKQRAEGSDLQEEPTDNDSGGDLQQT
jgi:hypothetical protein